MRTCSVDGCEKRHVARGYCWKHYARLRRTGAADLVIRQYTPRGSITSCTVDGCESRYHARGLCKIHYERVARTGSTERTSMVNDGPCLVVGCDRAAEARGYCDMHYYRLRRFGSADYVPPDRYGGPQVLPVGVVPSDAGQPMPYSRDLRDYRAVMERVDADRDERDYARWPEYERAYEAQAARWRAQDEVVAA